jgi:hypothetical protein
MVVLGAMKTATPELRKRHQGGFTARVELAADQAPEGQQRGGVGPEPSRIFDTEERARTWLLESLHELVVISGFVLRLNGEDFGDDVDHVLSQLVVE